MEGLRRVYGGSEGLQITKMTVWVPFWSFWGSLGGVLEVPGGVGKPF